jgi:DNA-binding MarR family transcriptional regulator
MVKRLTNPFHDRGTPLGTLFTAAGQRLSAELDTSLRTAGFPDLRSAHAPIFMAIDPAGSRVTELAERARMTKQAAGELIRYLIERGYLTSTVEADDRRARRVELTERGWEAIEVGEHVIGDFERWLDDAIGAEQVELLRQVLTSIADSTPSDRPVPEVTPPGRPEAQPRDL